MNRHVAITTALMILSSFTQTSHSQQLRSFSNKSGKEIKASIVSASGKDVTLKMENGNVITAGVNFFSEADQTYIKKWALENPPQIEYMFNVTAARTRTDRSKGRDGNLIVTNEIWKYNIKLENRSRGANKGSTVEGLRMAYNIAVTPNAQGKRASTSIRNLRSSGKHAVKAGVMDLPSIDYLGKGEYLTATFPVNESELSPDYYYPDGSDEEREDKLEGIWIKILKGDEVVFEEKSGSKALKSMKWVNP